MSERVQVLINEFSCAKEVYKIAIKRWRIDANNFRTRRARGLQYFFLLNHGECNSLAKQCCTCIDSSCTLQTCADKVVNHRNFERYATAVAYFPFRPISVPRPTPVT